MKNRLPADARLTLLLYNLCFPVVLLLMLPGLVVRLVRRGNFRFRFGQRFALYDREVVQRIAGQRRIWVQSISVGETMLALKLIRAMREVSPELRCVLSVTTSTGFAVAHAAESAWLEVIYNPLDFPPFVRRALRLIEPQRLIVIEGMWPNLAAGAKQQGAFLGMIARLSPRSERRFRRFRFLTGPLFRLFDRILEQDEADIARWQALGVHAQSLVRVGGIKFDAGVCDSSREEEFRRLLTLLRVTRDTPVLLAGSTFPGEEQLLANVFRDLRARFPDLFLILVPRHAERARDLLAELAPLGLKIVLRTQMQSEAALETTTRPDVLLIDSTGELRDWYRVATVAFTGKSLRGTGGQNPVEPALAGVPVLFGPHMENFATIASALVECGAAIQVATAEQLKETVSALLVDPARRARMAEAAQHALQAHQGATARAARLLLNG